jgi:hypothetical protein
MSSGRKNVKLKKEAVKALKEWKMTKINRNRLLENKNDGVQQENG